MGDVGARRRRGAGPLIMEVPSGVLSPLGVPSWGGAVGQRTPIPGGCSGVGPLLGSHRAAGGAVGWLDGGTPTPLLGEEGERHRPQGAPMGFVPSRAGSCCDPKRGVTLWGRWGHPQTHCWRVGGEGSTQGFVALMLGVRSEVCPLVGIPSHPPVWGGSMGWGGTCSPTAGEGKGLGKCRPEGWGALSPGSPMAPVPLWGPKRAQCVGRSCGVGADPTASRGGAAAEKNIQQTSMVFTVTGK